MSTQPSSPYYSPEEYLRLERRAEHKSEYLDGKIYAMAGATRSHVRITRNLTTRLDNALADSPCEVFGSDMRVNIPASNIYTYPDLSVACEDQESLDLDQSDVLANPILIVEVLSRTTENYDRRTKFAHYRQIPSLREYLLISQNKPEIEYYVRQRDDGNLWLLSIVSGLDAIIELSSLGISLSLRDVYARVRFPNVSAPNSGVAPEA